MTPKQLRDAANGPWEAREVAHRWTCGACFSDLMALFDVRQGESDDDARDRIEADHRRLCPQLRDLWSH